MIAKGPDSPSHLTSFKYDQASERAQKTNRCSNPCILEDVENTGFRQLKVQHLAPVGPEVNWACQRTNFLSEKLLTSITLSLNVLSKQSWYTLHPALRVETATQMV